MPNWVENTLNVYGDEEYLKNFSEYVSAKGKSVFCFNKIIPMPEDTKPWEKDGCPGWYRWSVDYWGTKWNCFDPEVVKIKDGLSYSFETAWAPPLPIYDKIITKYKELNFEIDALETQNFYTAEITASGGQYTKMIFDNSGLNYQDKFFL